jgi:hypothetical protein
LEAFHRLMKVSQLSLLFCSPLVVIDFASLKQCESGLKATLIVLLVEGLQIQASAFVAD